MKKKHIDMIKSYGRLESQRLLQLEEMKATCDHRIEKDDRRSSSALKPVGDAGTTFKCTICHEKINLAEINKEELKGATRIIKDAINAIKVTEEDMPFELLQQFGAALVLLQKLPESYDKLVVERLHEDTYHNQYQGASFNHAGVQNMGYMDPRMGAVIANPLIAMGYDGKKKKKGGKNKNKNKNRRGYYNQY